MKRSDQAQQAYVEISKAVITESIPKYGEKITLMAVSIRNFGSISERLEELDPSLAQVLSVSVGQFLSTLPSSIVNDMSCCEDWIEREIEARMNSYEASIQQIDNIINFPTEIVRGVAKRTLD